MDKFLSGFGMGGTTFNVPVSNGSGAMSNDSQSLASSTTPDSDLTAQNKVRGSSDGCTIR